MKSANNKGAKRELRRMRRSIKQQSRKTTVHVAVVMTKDMLLPINSLQPSCRAPFGDWATFTGTDRDLVVQRAIEAVRKWGEQQYEVWSGTLTGRVVVPTNFKVVKL